MKRIDWRVIPYSEMRYPSSGDWYWDDEDPGVLRIRVSHLSDPRWEFLLGFHELTEAMLCKFMGVSQEAVDWFDFPYERAYQRGERYAPCGCAFNGPSDPGSDTHAPYRFQHRIADAVERVLAAVLGVDWAAYDAEVDKPPQ